MADLAYRGAYATNRMYLGLRLLTTYQQTGSIRFAARRAASASAQTVRAKPPPAPTSDSLASTTSL